MANDRWCKGSVLMEILGLEEACVCPRRKTDILCKGCMKKIPSQILHDTIYNMCFNAQLLDWLNKHDELCPTMVEYQAKRNMFVAALTDEILEVRQRLEERMEGVADVGAGARIAHGRVPSRSRSPPARGSVPITLEPRVTITEALTRASKTQLLNEIFSRMP
jgi:hypothetical protein